MKIQALDAVNNPLATSRVQILVKSQAGGLLTFTTDSKGFFTLDDKFKGLQIAYSLKGALGEFTTATDGALLKSSVKEPTE